MRALQRLAIIVATFVPSIALAHESQRHVEQSWWQQTVDSEHIALYTLPTLFVLVVVTRLVRSKIKSRSEVRQKIQSDNNRNV